ncbi:MAG: enoyl-CoA hydratase family protein [Myxococcota bacterium]|nr:enoyl-CoA hydratase family protein [Myxococcota bacterium]
MSITTQIDGAIAEVVMERPPVNALDSAGWFELAKQIEQAASHEQVCVVVLRAEGRGFNAGVDLKSCQASPGHEELLAVNRGCFAAFKAVYECQVPLIVAVNGYCLGGGIGLVGNADMVIASDDASFGLPEIDRGALGGATQLARLVPSPQRLRSLVFTGERIDAQELQRYGSIQAIVPQAELRNEAMRWAAKLANKDPRVLRAAKSCLNGIDAIDVNRSYRYEQGYTFELNLSGHGDEARSRFVKESS